MGFIGFPVGAVGSTPQLGGPGLALIRSVSFTSTASVSLDYCFTSNYENYRIMLKLNSSATATMRLRLTGADDASANYYDQYFSVDNTATAAGRESAQTSWNIHGAAATAAISMDIFGPALALATYGNEILANSTTGIRLIPITLFHNVGTAYDGFSILGTGLSGTLSIYGYRK